MVDAGVRIGVDVCSDGWCPSRFEGTVGFIVEEHLASLPSLPIRTATANPGVYDYDVPVELEQANRAPSASPDWMAGSICDWSISRYNAVRVGAKSP